MNTTAANQRNVYLDIVKAFTIICVVIGHCIQSGSGAYFFTAMMYFENAIFKIIYTYHMPLFMVISGYLFAFSVRNKSWSKMILHKVQTLLIPIFLWSFIPFVLLVVQQNNNNETVNMLTLAKEYVLTSLENLWFLWAVFWCSIIVTMIRRFFHDSKWIYLLGFVLTFFILDDMNIYLYEFMYPYFLLGYFYNKDDLGAKLKKYYTKSSIILLSGLLFAVLFSMYNWDSLIYTSKYCILGEAPFAQFCTDIYRFLIGLVGSVFLLMVFYRLNQRRVFQGKTERLLTFIGTNTIGVYIISNIICAYILNRITKHLTGINYAVTIVEVLAVLSFSLLCTQGIRIIKPLNTLLLGGRSQTQTQTQPTYLVEK